MAELFEALLRIFEGFAGFRYLLSAQYRKKTKERWLVSPGIVKVMDIFAGVFGILLIVMIVVLTIWYSGGNSK